MNRTRALKQSVKQRPLCPTGLINRGTAFKRSARVNLKLPDSEYNKRKRNQPTLLIPGLKEACA